VSYPDEELTEHAQACPKCNLGEHCRVAMKIVDDAVERFVQQQFQIPREAPKA
jgi:hypothetical protein